VEMIRHRKVERKECDEDRSDCRVEEEAVV
jgi:hypothetical protein